MTDTATGAPLPAVAPKGFFTRVIGVFTSPRETFADIAARPTFAGALVLSTLIIVLMTTGLAMTQRGQDMALDQVDRVVQGVERMTGRPMPDDQYDAMVRRVRGFPTQQLVGSVVGVPIFFAIEAGVLFVIFTSIMGGESRYKQVLAVLVFASLIPAAGLFFSIPIQYAKHSLDITPTSMMVFLPFLGQRSFFARFINWFDLFRVWWIVTLSIGLAVLYRRRSGPVIGIVGSLWAAFALVAATIGSLFSGA